MLTLLLSAALAAPPDTKGLTASGAGALRHPSAVRAVAITPDSRKAFAALDDGSLHAYTLDGRKPVETGFHAYSIAFALAIDPAGERLAVGDGNGDVTLLDARSHKVIKKVRLKAEPQHLAFGPKGESLFVGQSDGHLVRLDGADLATKKDIFPTEGSRVIALACSPAGTVATSDREGKIKLWTADELKPVREWKAHDVFARSLAFDPPGRHLVSGGEDGALKVWNPADGALVKESKEYHQESIQCIAFGPDGRMVTGGHDGLCQFWDGRTFEAGKSYPNYRGYITASAVSADGKWLVRGGSFLDFVPTDRPAEFERVAEYGGTITGFAVAPDAKRFVTAGLDRRLILWRVERGITSKVAHTADWVTAVDFCSGGKSVAAALADGRVEVYSADGLARQSSWPAHKGRVTAVAAVGTSLVSAGEDGAVHLWDPAGKKLKTFAGTSPCRSVAVRETRFAVGTADGTVSVYDAPAGALVKRVKGRPMSVTAVGFSRGGTRLMVGYFDGGLESFDTTSWAVVRYRPGDGESVLSISPNPGNDLVAVGFRDGYARLLDVVTLTEGLAVQPGPGLEVFAIRWVLDGNTFAVAGASNAIHFQAVKGDVEAWTKKFR